MLHNGRTNKGFKDNIWAHKRKALIANYILSSCTVQGNNDSKTSNKKSSNNKIVNIQAFADSSASVEAALAAYVLVL